MIRSLLAAAILLSLGPVKGLAESQDWLINGDFDSQGGWGGILSTEPGPEGQNVVSLENDDFQWKGYQQTVTLSQPLPASIEVTGRLKTEGIVKGTNDWEMARITVLFTDDAGNRVGDWPAPVAQEEGTQDWAAYDNSYTPPPGATRMVVGLTLENCKGQAWWSGIHCYLYDYDWKPIPVGGQAHPNLKPPLSVLSPNWLLDPGFEAPGSRDWQGSQLSSPGHDSLHSLSFSNDRPNWTLASQIVDFKGQTPVSVVYGGWLKTQGVTLGTESYMAARLGIDFRDANGKQVGGWQAEACAVTGTTGWTHYEQAYAVPSGATQVQVDAGLGNCTGRMWADDLLLQLIDAKGRPITTQVSEVQVSDTSDWYAYQAPSDPTATAIDLSYLNDKPAGTHGFITVKQGRFVFADGTPARFWGTDLVGPHLFLTHDQADAIALRLSRLGVNLVRLHMADADWTDNNFFDPKADNTLTLSPTQVEKFDYLVAALKKNGIYVYPDWMVGRKFRPGDGVKDYQGLTEGAKGAVYFDPRIIVLNQLYGKEILEHVNPYTHQALKDDPAYLGNEIINESSIFTDFHAFDWPQSYWDELQSQYKAWGGKGNITHFDFDYDQHCLRVVQDPENEEQTLRFLYAKVLKTDLDMRKFLKHMSRHGLMAGSNMGLPILGDIASDAQLDYMDTHSYWDHPQIWNIVGGWADVAHAPMFNRAQLLDPFGDTLLEGLCQSAVKGKPLIVTEWNDCFPNEYRLEGPVLMAVYGSLQGWDGLLQFDYGTDAPGATRMSNFSLETRVDNEPLFQAGALIFRKGLLKDAPVTVEEPLSDQTVFKDHMKSDWIFNNPWLPYAVKVEKVFTGKKEVAPQDLTTLVGLHSETDKKVESCTGEESLDYGNGVLTLQSQQVEGFTGAIGNGQASQGKALTVKADLRNPWASVLAISLDGKPLGRSAKVLLVAVARAENSGQTYNATRTALKDPGHAPVLMQGVQADLQLAVPGGHWSVVPLNSSGQAQTALASSVTAGELAFTLSPKDQTSYYLISAGN